MSNVPGKNDQEIKRENGHDVTKKGNVNGIKKLIFRIKLNGG